MRFIRVSISTTPPDSGLHPPASPVPAPRGTIGQSNSLQTRTTAATCCAERGKTTAVGGWRSTVKASQS